MCDCVKAQHEHGTWQMYKVDGCGCDPCTTAYTAYSRDLAARRTAARPAKRQAAPKQAATPPQDLVQGVFVATFPIHGGTSDARAKRQAYDQLLALTREQGVTVKAAWQFRVEHTRKGRFLTARAPAETDRPRAEVRAAAEHLAYEHEQAHPALARWIHKHLEVAA